MSWRNQGNLRSWVVGVILFLCLWGWGRELGGNPVLSIALSRSPFSSPFFFMLFFTLGVTSFQSFYFAPRCNKRMALLCSHSLFLPCEYQSCHFVFLARVSRLSVDSTHHCGEARWLGSRTGCFGLSFSMLQRAQLAIPYGIHLPNVILGCGEAQDYRLQLSFFFVPRRDWVW